MAVYTNVTLQSAITGAQGTTATFTVDNDISDVQLTIPTGTTITLTASDLNQNTLTALSTARHFSISGTGNLTLRNFKLIGNGDNSGGVSVPGAGFATFENCTFDSCKSTDNGGAVYMNGSGATVSFNGTSVIKNCEAINGGGIYLDNNGTLNLTGTHIYQNRAVMNVVGSNQGLGGGIYVATPTSTLMASNALIEENIADQNGGGIYFYNARTANNNITSITVSNNQAIHGGGIYARSALTLANATITGNEALLGDLPGGGGLYVNGGLILSDSEISNNHSVYNGAGMVLGNATHSLTQVNIFGNVASPPVGLVAQGGGGIFLNSISPNTTTLQDVHIYNNSAVSGGGLYSQNSGTVTLQGSTIIGSETPGNGNTANDHGGGVYLDNGSIVILQDGTRIVGNTANKNGGGAYLFSNNTSLTLQSGSQIANNTALLNGGGVWINNVGIFNLEAGSLLVGNIAEGNTPEYDGLFGGGGIFNSYGTVNLSGGLIQNNTATHGHGGGVLVRYNNYAHLTVTSGFIINNTAPQGDGGGIFLDWGIFLNWPNPPATTTSISIAAPAIFNGNLSRLAYHPPTNISHFTNIDFAATSIYDHILNNHDINFKTHTLTLHPQNGTSNTIQYIVGLDGDHTGVNGDTDRTVLKPSDPTPATTNQVFLDWTISDGTPFDWTLFEDSYFDRDYTVINADLDLYATYADLITVIFNRNNSGIPQQVIQSGELVVEPDGSGLHPREEWHDYYLGWAYEGENSTFNFDEPLTVDSYGLIEEDGGLVLYLEVKFAPIIFYHLIDGDNTDNMGTMLEGRTKAQLDTVVRQGRPDGFQISGWYTDAQFLELAPSDFIQLSDDIWAYTNVADSQANLGNLLNYVGIYDTEHFDTLLIRGSKNSSAEASHFDLTSTVTKATARTSATLQNYYADGAYIVQTTTGKHINLTSNFHLTLKNVQLQGRNADPSVYTVTGGGINISGSGTEITLTGANTLPNFGNVANCGNSGNGAALVIGTGSTAYVDGNFNIKDNNADSAAGIFNSGGTLYLQGNSHVTNNYSKSASNGGGGIFANGGTTYIKGEAEISQNTARNGGGFIVSGNGIAYISEQAKFLNNVAYGRGGGAMSILGSGSLYVSGDVLISGNQATGTSDVSALHLNGYGGGIGGGDFTNNGSNSYTRLIHISENVQIVNNSALQSGGGICFWDYDFTNDFQVTGTVNIENNTAGQNGGGIFTEKYSNLLVGEDVTFSGNVAKSDAIVVSDTDLATYASNIGATVWSDTPRTKPLNAEGYNNYDINYVNVDYEFYDGTDVVTGSIYLTSTLSEAEDQLDADLTSKLDPNGDRLYSDWYTDADCTEAFDFEAGTLWDFEKLYAYSNVADDHDTLDGLLNNLSIYTVNPFDTLLIRGAALADSSSQIALQDQIDLVTTRGELTLKSYDDTAYIAAPIGSGIRHLSVVNGIASTLTLESVQLRGHIPADSQMWDDDVAHHFEVPLNVNPNPILSSDLPEGNNERELREDEAWVLGGGLAIDADSSLTLVGANEPNFAHIAYCYQDVSGGGLRADGDTVLKGNFTIAYNYSSIEPTTSDVPYAEGGGGVYTNKSLLVEEDVAITYNKATAHGGGVFVKDGTFTFQSGAITHNQASTINGSYGGGGVFHSSGTFEMHGGSIDYNRVSNGGGGVYHWKSGSILIAGGTINHNTTTSLIADGGGFCLFSNDDSLFTMTGGDVSYNYSARRGGGIHASGRQNSVNDGRYHTLITGGTITYNEAADYGGGLNTSFQDFKIQGAVDADSVYISHNIAGTNGGGFYAQNGNAVYQRSPLIENATLTDNTAGLYGGGIYTDKGVSTTVNFAHIANNTAQLGGGIFRNNGTLQLSATVMEHNAATSINTNGSGGAIYTGTGYANLTIDGLSTFSQNTAPTQATYVTSADAATYATHITATTWSDTPSPKPQNALGFNNYDINYVGPSVHYHVYDGLQMIEGTIPYADDFQNVLENHIKSTMPPGYALSPYWYPNSNFITHLNLSVYPTTDIYNYDNVADDNTTLSQLLNGTSGIYHDLFGTVLIRGENAEIDEETSKGTITLTDSSPLGLPSSGRTVTLQKFYNGGGFIKARTNTRHMLVTSGATYTLNFIDVQFQGLNPEPYVKGTLGGGLTFNASNVTLNLSAENELDMANIAYCYVDENNLAASIYRGSGSALAVAGNLNLSGNLRISSNRSEDSSPVGCSFGAIYHGSSNEKSFISGILSMSGNVEISYNVVDGENTTNVKAGAGIYSCGTVNISGGFILNNETMAEQGGGAGIFIQAPGSSVTVNGNAVISGNKSAYIGGGIRSMILTGQSQPINAVTIGGNALISNNIASFQGGGMHCNNLSGTLVITGGTISDNQALTSAGGGVMIQGPATISSATIENNTASVAAGGLYVASNLTIADSFVHNNKAGYAGGMIYGGVLNMSRTEVTNNKAFTTYGGGMVKNSTANSIIQNNSVISENTAMTGGAGIFNQGSGSLTISNTEIHHNVLDEETVSMLGGGIYNHPEATSVDLHSVYFHHNEATLGGAIYRAGGTINVHSSIFESNQALSYNLLYGSGGAIFTLDDYTKVTADINSTFSNNIAPFLALAVAQINVDTYFANILVPNDNWSIPASLALTPAIGYNNADINNLNYTVTFHTTHGTAPASQYLLTNGSGKAYNPGAPTSERFQFNGWLKDNEPYDFNAFITADIDLYADWSYLPMYYLQDGENELTGLIPLDATPEILTQLVLDQIAETYPNLDLAAKLKLEISDWHTDRNYDISYDFDLLNTEIVQDAFAYNNVADSHQTLQSLLIQQNYGQNLAAIQYFDTLLIRGEFQLENALTLKDEEYAVTLHRFYPEGGFIVTAPSKRHLYVPYVNEYTLHLVDVQFKGLNPDHTQNGMIGGGLDFGQLGVTLNISATNTEGFTNITDCFTEYGTPTSLSTSTSLTGWSTIRGGAALLVYGNLNMEGNLKISHNRVFGNPDSSNDILASVIHGRNNVETAPFLYTFQMKGGIISENITEIPATNQSDTSYGGGVIVYGTMIMSGGLIDGNQALGYGVGGGICVRKQTATLELTGGTISNNYAGQSGGGIYLHADLTSPTVFTTSQDPQITGNKARIGGGIYVSSKKQVLMNGSIITDNTATSNTGGLFLTTDSHADLTNVTISDNHAETYAGGIRTAGTLILDNCTITDNTAITYGGGIVKNSTFDTKLQSTTLISNNTAGTFGAGIYHQNTGTLKISNSEITENVAQQQGGAIYTTANAGELTLNQSTNIHGNIAQQGAGIYAQSDVTLDTSILHDHMAKEGGAIYQQTGTLTGTATITGNNAKRGAGIYNNSPASHILTNGEISHNIATKQGGGIYLNAGNLSIEGTQILSNDAVQGGGVYNLASLHLTDATMAGNGNPDTTTAGGGTYTSHYENLTVTDCIFDENHAITIATVATPEQADIYAENIHSNLWSDCGYPENAQGYNNPDINNDKILITYYDGDEKIIEDYWNAGIAYTIQTTTSSQILCGFTGWKDSDGTSYSPLTLHVLTENLDLYAQWECLEPDCCENGATGPTGPTGPAGIDAPRRIADGLSATLSGAELIESEALIPFNQIIIESETIILENGALTLAPGTYILHWWLAVQGTDAVDNTIRIKLSTDSDPVTSHIVNEQVAAMHLIAITEETTVTLINAGNEPIKLAEDLSVQGGLVIYK